MQPRQVELGDGMHWYTCGWQLFRRVPIIWVAILLVLALINVILMFVPVIGQLTLMLVSPVFLGGLYRGAKTVDDNGRLHVKTLFAGFSDRSKTSSLLILGAMMLAATIVLTLIATSLIGGSLTTGHISGSDVVTKISAGIGTFFGVLVLLLLEGSIIMVLFYAVPLVMLDQLTPIEAVKLSANACLINMLPFLLFGVIYLVLAFLAAIPFFLGYLVLMPVSLCAAYCSYKSIFHP